MAIKESAKKAIRSDKRKAVFNLRRKRAVLSIEKEIAKLLKDNKVDEAQAKLGEGYKAIDKAAKRGLLKDNTAARRKSKLSRMIKVAKESK